MIKRYSILMLSIMAMSTLCAFDQAEDQANREKWPLHYAAYTGDVKQVKSLLAAGHLVDSKTPYDSTPLHVAALNGNLDVVKVLLEAGAKAGYGDKNYGFTALHLAANKGNANLIQMLLVAGAQANCMNSEKQSPLYLAAEGGHLEAVKLLLSAGANPNVKTAEGTSKFLEQPMEMGKTPLYVACKRGYEQVVKELLDAGAYVDTRCCEEFNDTGELTALHAAAFGSNIGTVKLLLAAGADVNSKTSLGNFYPLSIALRSPFIELEVVKLLLDSGANPNSVCDGGNPPLHIIILSQPFMDLSARDDIIRLLLAAGASIFAVDNNGRTVQDYVKEQGDWSLEQIFREHLARTKSAPQA